MRSFGDGGLQGWDLGEIRYGVYTRNSTSPPTKYKNQISWVSARWELAGADGGQNNGLLWESAASGWANWTAFYCIVMGQTRWLTWVDLTPQAYEFCHDGIWQKKNDPKSLVNSLGRSCYNPRKEHGIFNNKKASPSSGIWLLPWTESTAQQVKWVEEGDPCSLFYVILWRS